MPKTLTKNIIEALKLLLVLIMLTSLMACQSNQVKNAAKETVSSQPSTFDWQQLQQGTLNDLREKSYGEAEVKISQMMEAADQRHERWEYIRMAIISMPQDLALQLIDQALNKNFIKNNNQQLFAFSRVLTQLKQEPQALELVNQVIQDEKSSEYVYWRARLLLLMDQDEAAEQDYKWLLKQEPDNINYINQYATLLSYLRRNDEALALLAGHEADVDLMFRQVVLLLQNNNDDLANEKFASLKELLVIDELNAQQKLEIGELAFWMKDHAFALELLQNVKTGDQVNEAKLLIANVLVDQGDVDRAAVVYHQVQNGPEQHAIPAYQLEIELYRQQGYLEQALQVANTGLQMFRNDVDLLYSRAMLHGEMDDISALEKDLRKIIADEPENADALNALGYTWADHDINLDLAYEYIMQANELKPNDQAILDSVGWIYYKKGDLVNAEKYLRLAIKDNTRDSESYLHLIEVLQKKGDQGALKSIIEMAQELFPDEKF